MTKTRTKSRLKVLYDLNQNGTISSAEELEYFLLSAPGLTCPDVIDPVLGPMIFIDTPWVDREKPEVQKKDDLNPVDFTSDLGKKIALDQ